MEKNTNSKIILQTHKRSDGTLMGEVQLNNPKAFNALDLEMVLALKDQLQTWENQEEVSLVYIHGAGGKAFCAGGNVKSLYKAILDCRSNNQDPAVVAQPFFEAEYRMNFLMHNYKKPIVLWGHGIVMGGGLGLFAGASHPIVTEASLLAMPEINIGLFPDVGGSYFLNRLVKNLGMYLALTSHRFNATEAQFLNLSSLLFESSYQKDLWNFLLSVSFKDIDNFDKQIHDFQKGKGLKQTQDNWIKKYQQDIQGLVESKDIQTIYKNFKNSTIQDSKWQKNKETFLKGSPSSAGVICEQLKRGESMSLKEVFQMELAMVLQFTRHFDFVEGVRAVLIDKTNDPKWNPKHFDELKGSWVEEHFQSLSDWNNPLKNL